jgi:Leucine-rich repeat (LRR) protein
MLKMIHFSARRLEISLNQNFLTGTLPLEYFERFLQKESQESPFRIKKLDISNNLLTGTVSPIAPMIPSLTYFDLSHNMFKGQVR